MQGRGGRLDDVEATYRRYFALIREKCRRMLGDFAEADDVAQETFVRLWRTNLRADDRRSVLAWIYKTGTRLAIDRLRERSKMAAADDEAVALVQLASSSPGGDDALATRRSLEVLARRLPADELEVALLFRLDGLSQAEIAEVARISERTVRRCLQRLDERVAKLREGILP
jgi:RNA polymerase sigma-70 factor (ECF subfamily)